MSDTNWGPNMGQIIGSVPAVRRKPDEIRAGEAEVRARLATDFPFYAGTNLKISAKTGQLVPFMLNKAQRYAHERLELQVKSRGYVRAMFLKGRQQGISTYIAGRFYWKVTHRKGVNAYILSHMQDTTDTLFNMTKRYHDNCNALVKQDTRAASAKELAFSSLDSSYSVGTAGSKEAGRGGTTQYFHGSEMAFWSNPEVHMAGVLQRVPSGMLAAGTEVILESTANGVGGLFHRMWKEAEAGENEYEAIFIPWFWQDEYRAAVPDGWEPAADGLVASHMGQFGLDRAQAYWMSLKIRELGGESKFKQEYPCTAQEAFQMSEQDTLIKSVDVLEAMKPKEGLAGVGPRVGCVDPARGGDRTSFAGRQGRVVFAIKSHHTQDLMEVCGLCVKYIQEWQLDKLFVLVAGMGAGVYDRLVEMGYGAFVAPVNEGGQSLEPERFANKRAEIWYRIKEWLYESPCQLPQLESLHSDLVAPKWRVDSGGRIILEKKEDMRARGLPSPDEGDALAGTFSFPVASQLQMSNALQQVEADHDWDVLE